MNFGNVIRYGLNKADLPYDANHLEMARFEANMIIEDLWYATKGDFRQSRSQITTIDGADEYVLTKYFDSFVKNTFQGPQSYPISLVYLTPEEFFRKIQLQQGTSGNQLVYTYGDTVGYDAQLLNASTLRVFSSLASKSVGTINIMSGDDRVKSSTNIFTQNDVGLRFQKNGDIKTYKIGKFISSREVQLTEKYRGASQTGASYLIGDIGIRVNVSGFIGGQITSEEMELNGSDHISSLSIFNTIVSISKTDRTGGNITVQDASGNTLGVMAPGEMEIERKTVLFWPKPSNEYTFYFRFFMLHPFLWLDSDRMLLPKKYHRLVAYKLGKRMLEQTNQEVPAGLERDIETAQTMFENDADDSSLMDAVPDGEDRFRGMGFYYDKIDPQF